MRENTNIVTDGPKHEQTTLLCVFMLTTQLKRGHAKRHVNHQDNFLNTLWSCMTVTLPDAVWRRKSLAFDLLSAFSCFLFHSFDSGALNTDATQLRKLSNCLDKNL